MMGTTYAVMRIGYLIVVVFLRVVLIILLALFALWVPVAIAVHLAESERAVHPCVTDIGFSRNLLISI